MLTLVAIVFSQRSSEINYARRFEIDAEIEYRREYRIRMSKRKFKYVHFRSILISNILISLAFKSILEFDSNESLTFYLQLKNQLEKSSFSSKVFFV